MRNSHVRLHSAGTNFFFYLYFFLFAFLISFIHGPFFFFPFTVFARAPREWGGEGGGEGMTKAGMQIAGMGPRNSPSVWTDVRCERSCGIPGANADGVCWFFFFFFSFFALLAGWLCASGSFLFLFIYLFILIFIYRALREYTLGFFSSLSLSL